MSAAWKVTRPDGSVAREGVLSDGSATVVARVAAAAFALAVIGLFAVLSPILVPLHLGLRATGRRGVMYDTPDGFRHLDLSADAFRRLASSKARRADP